jgi:hypothetical protein
VGEDGWCSTEGTVGSIGGSQGAHLILGLGTSSLFRWNSVLARGMMKSPPAACCSPLRSYQHTSWVATSYNLLLIPNIPPLSLLHAWRMDDV